MTTTPRAIPPVPISLSDWYPWCSQMAQAINSMLAGKHNNTTTVTLAASVATTTLTDSRIGAFSWIGLMPQTANASAEVGNGTIYIAAQQSGQATITHANNAQVDRTYRVVIHG